VDGVPTAFRVLMKDKDQGTSTELDIRAVDYEGSLPDELFDPANLSHISAHKIWGSNVCGVAKAN